MIECVYVPHDFILWALFNLHKRGESSIRFSDSDGREYQVEFLFAESHVLTTASITRYDPLRTVSLEMCLLCITHDDGSALEAAGYGGAWTHIRMGLPVFMLD